MKNKIRFWNVEDGDQMLNKEDKEEWCSWDENDNWL